MLTTSQIAVVRSTWEMVVPIKAQAAALFYENLLQVNPELRPMFAQTEMTDQQQKLMIALALVVRSLDDLEVVLPALQSLGRKHVHYGVTDAHYDMVGAALLDTLGQGLGTAFTPEARAAWTTAYGIVAGVMKEAASREALAA